MIPADRTPEVSALPPEIWQMIYTHLGVEDIVNLECTGHPIKLESESFWEGLLTRFFVKSTICRGSRDARQIFLDLANFQFSKQADAPLVSSRTSSSFVPQPNEQLVLSPFMVDRGVDDVAEVWDFAKMAKFRFALTEKRGCVGVDGHGASLERDEDDKSVLRKYDYAGNLTCEFVIPFDASECNIFCTNDNIDCTFLVQGLHKFYVNWNQKELNDVGYISAAVNVANGQIYCLLGHSLAICDFDGNYTPLDVLFNTDLRSPRWIGGGNRFLVISQSRGSTRLIYLIDAVNRSYVSWSVDSDKRDPDEYQVWEDQVIMWYMEGREALLEEFLTPWENAA
ncbi:hypothetical protein CJU89_2794 [Yarrowia sp. B02]|nr:hypothetical protein CJU89_2794 [Yarrowia sp. B02]